jgi:hypothetical protein
MFNHFITHFTNTLTKKPEYGIISSIFSFSISATEALQLVGVLLGLFIAIITAVLKVIELRDKIIERRRGGE